MIYRVTHTTTYEYAGTVSLSHHLLRLRPRDMDRQRCLHHEMQIEPRPDVLCPHLDYFGNSLTFATIEGSHRGLSIVSHSKVEVTASATVDVKQSPPWEEARDLAAEQNQQVFLDTREFIYDSPLIKLVPEFAAYAASSFSPGRPLLDAILHLTGRVYADFKFDPSATNVATPVLEVFQKRRGVCQDFAQLQIGCLRAMGIAARYVSGYLETEPPAGRPRLAGADASHAWVSVYCPGNGWVDVDPTNNLLVADRHITVGWGRDYSDVSPIRGIIMGSGEHSMEVAVDVIPLPESSSFETAFLTKRPSDSALPKL